MHSPFRQDAGGSPPSYQPALPPRDWHIAVKEYVRQQLYGEMEPIRVQVALLQKQMHILDEKSQQLVPARHERENSRVSDRSALSEKKLEEMNPHLENLIHITETKLGETTTRLARAEGVIKEITALQDKFTQRQDSLTECMQDLDSRFDRVHRIVMKENFDPIKPVPPAPNSNHLQSVPEHYAPQHGYKDEMTPGWVPPPAPYNAPATRPPPPSAAAAHVWTASDHQASLEVEEFSFQVDRRPGVSLGMILRNNGSKLVVDQASNGSSLPVSQGDRIVAIDGIRGDSHILLELIQRTGKFKITCQRLLSTTL
jgi:hypothetical protein